MDLQIVSRQDQIVVVQDNDTYKRVVLPAQIHDPLKVKHFNAGAPYGLPWEEFCDHPDVPKELRKRGIYFVNDLRTNQTEVLAAIQTAYGNTMRQILRSAKQYERSHK